VVRRKDESPEAKEWGEFVALLAHWWSHIELVKLCVAVRYILAKRLRFECAEL
jgi:hypothetical protein